MNIAVAFLGCLRQKREQIAARTCVSFSVAEDSLVKPPPCVRASSFLNLELTTTLADEKVLLAPKRNPTPTSEIGKELFHSFTPSTRSLRINVMGWREKLRSS